MPPVPPLLLARARQLRKDATDAEMLLWNILRNRQMEKQKFRRQHRLGSYILDFYCMDLKLAVELDGGQHGEDNQRRYDEIRTTYLLDQGVRVLRFWNHEMLKETEMVVGEIWEAVVELSGESGPWEKLQEP